MIKSIKGGELSESGGINGRGARSVSSYLGSNEETFSIP